MSDDKHNIEENIATAIAKSEVKTIVKDAVELTIDSFMEDGLAKDIPGVSWFYSLYKGYMTLSDRIYCKKLLCFLDGAEEASKKDREEFIERLKTTKEQKKVGDKLMLHIEKCDDYKKALILGRLYAMVIKGEMKISVFHRLAFVLNQIFLDDLIYFEDKVYPVNWADKSNEMRIMQNFATLNLMNTKSAGSGQLGYEINQWGKYLKEAIKDVVIIEYENHIHYGKKS